MLVGEPPFTGPSVQAIKLARLITEDPRGIAAQFMTVPDHVEAAVLHALEEVAGFSRFATAADFALALRDGATPVQPGRSATPSHRAKPRAQVASARVAINAPFALGGVLLGLFAARFSLQPGPSSGSVSARLTSILAPASGTGSVSSVRWRFSPDEAFRFRVCGDGRIAETCG